MTWQQRPARTLQVESISYNNRVFNVAEFFEQVRTVQVLEAFVDVEYRRLRSTLTLLIHC
jgi:hypothetical protein